MAFRSPGGSSRDQLRQVGKADHHAVSRVLVEAFFDDPVAAWVCPDERLRRRMLRRFYSAYLAAMQRHEWSWAPLGLDGAALWAPPGRWRISLLDMLSVARAMLGRKLLPRLPLVGSGLLKVDRSHPDAPDHFFLAMLGVAPSSQGRGLGSALLAPTLALCDREGVPAYLESSKWENVAFYARHGFRQTGEVALPRGPVIFPMWREPRGEG